MESKPLRVQAAEACGLELFQANGLHGALTWMIAERNSPGRLLPMFDTDDAAALELAVAFADKNSLAVDIHRSANGTWIFSIPWHEIAESNRSLARAICLAVVAAGEKSS